MKLDRPRVFRGDVIGFSAQPRADGDEAALGANSLAAALHCFSAQPRADGDEACDEVQPRAHTLDVSVLNREPMGMKPGKWRAEYTKSLTFQCSTASRWG